MSAVPTIAEAGAGVGRSATPGFVSRAMGGRVLPVLLVVLAIVALWYLGAAWLNWQTMSDRLGRGGTAAGFGEVLRGTMASDRPILPAPHQIVAELWKTVAETRITSPRSLLYHCWVTLASTLLGFAIGSALGILLAVGIVHSRTLDRSLMPWIITSQTIPILAVAPMIIVVLASVGVTGLVPKAIISTYLSFFPVTVGMVKGLRSPDTMLLDLMRTYDAGGRRTLEKLRLPASLPFLFASCKIAVAAALVGAIVGELPTGAQAGLGARLLAGSYYGQTVQIWAALIAASVMAGLLVATVGAAERIARRRLGAA